MKKSELIKENNRLREIGGNPQWSWYMRHTYASDLYAIRDAIEHKILLLERDNPAQAVAALRARGGGGYGMTHNSAGGSSLTKGHGGHG